MALPPTPQAPADDIKESIEHFLLQLPLGADAASAEVEQRVAERLYEAETCRAQLQGKLTQWWVAWQAGWVQELSTCACCAVCGVMRGAPMHQLSVPGSLHCRADVAVELHNMVQSQQDQLHQLQAEVTVYKTQRSADNPAVVAARAAALTATMMGANPALTPPSHHTPGADSDRLSAIKSVIKGIVASSTATTPLPLPSSAHSHSVDHLFSSAARDGGPEKLLQQTPVLHDTDGFVVITRAGGAGRTPPTASAGAMITPPPYAHGAGLFTPTDLDWRRDEVGYPALHVEECTRGM